MILALLMLLVAWSAQAQAAATCDTASASSMDHPPLDRILTVTVPVRASGTTQVLRVAVTSRGQTLEGVFAARAGGRSMAALPTRDKNKRDGVRVFELHSPPFGDIPITVTYRDPQQADALLAVVCVDVDPTKTATADTTPTATPREKVSLTGADGTESVMTFTGADPATAELTLDTERLKFRSLGTRVRDAR